MKISLNTLVLGTVLLAALPGALAQPPNAPFAGQAKMTCAQALKEAPKDDPQLAALAKTFDADTAKLKKSPKDAKVKKAYVDDGAKYAHQVIYGDSKLSPAVKYRAGLALCRLVLKVDPKNPDCMKSQNEIESIYKQMGRPIPQ
jgi:hypothetical protein